MSNDSSNKIDELAEKYQIDKKYIKTALKNLKEHKAIFLTVSGKFGSGKDTIAPKLIKKLGYTETVHESFARPLKDEMDEIISHINNSNSQKEAIETVKEQLDASNPEFVVDVLWNDVKSGAVKSAYDRTLSTRRALQYWGTEVRRAIDDLYWVRKAMQTSIAKIAHGYSIYVTDSRFPNEADAVSDFNGTIIRLFVSQEEQTRRLELRDGHAPSADAMTHTSEIAMDSYDFDYIVNTDLYNADEVVDECFKLLTHKSFQNEKY